MTIKIIKKTSKPVLAGVDWETGGLILHMGLYADSKGGLMCLEVSVATLSLLNNLLFFFIVLDTWLKSLRGVSVHNDIKLGSSVSRYKIHCIQDIHWDTDDWKFVDSFR